MAERFRDGGRLLAFGHGPYATDAQHVAVEFVHPVIVGKRALPALDLSFAAEAGVRAVAQPRDIVMGFAPPEGDPAVAACLAEAYGRGCLTLALPGRDGHYAPAAPSADAFIHQEMIEILYHTLWETVHVFLEHRELGHEVGAAGFLYPFLGQSAQNTDAVLGEVAASIITKAQEDERLRDEIARSSAAPIADAALALHERLAAGGQLICFGNGGSATDANDFAMDCVVPPASLGLRPLPAISLALEPANLSAIANDIGAETIFLRQLIAQARPHDAVVAFSTSGGSANIVAALQEARKRGLLTVALLGYDGGEIVRRGLADVALVVPCDYIPRIQEIHASIYHVLRELLDITHGGT
jgi:D-sedoheptulose 7-phosphate isomerase